jgi:hypothetical protein
MGLACVICFSKRHVLISKHFYALFGVLPFKRDFPRFYPYRYINLWLLTRIVITLWFRTIFRF